MVTVSSLKKELEEKIQDICIANLEIGKKADIVCKFEGVLYSVPGRFLPESLSKYMKSFWKVSFQDIINIKPERTSGRRNIPPGYKDDYIAIYK